MHTGNHYKLSEFIIWTRRDIYCIFIISVVVTLLYDVAGFTWMALPWVAVAIVGTAAAFIVGFKNTQTYNRLWEARQIYGAIVNGSRTWGIMVQDFVKAGPQTHKELIYRHCAWLTALRYQLRKPAPWENQFKPYNKEYHTFFKVPEWEASLEEDLKPYITTTEHTYILIKKNRATHIIALQGKQLAKLAAEGLINPFELVELERQLAGFYEQQGKCERIKNFPYPRQFSSITLFFVWLFVIILPMGLVGEFNKIGTHCVWFTIPVSTLLAWVFTCMEKVGEATENPFEGGPNDVPITAMSRTIEIDLRDMLDETTLPEPLLPVNNILM
jgi:putative membrane protein